MTRAEILRMAKEAGFGTGAAMRGSTRDIETIYKAWLEEIEAFHALAVAAERERCKRIVQSWQYRNGHHTHEGTTMGHFDMRMIADIDSGLPPKF